MTRLIILAAGRGRRLGSLTDDTPKCLQNISGKSLLDWQIRVAQSVGIEDIVIVRGHLAAQVSFSQMTYVDNKAYESTNMVYSLWCARDYLNGNIIVSYGDILFTSEVLSAMCSTSDDLAVAIDRQWLSYWSQRFDDVLSDAETLELGLDGRIVGLGERTNDLNRVQGQYIGLMRFSISGTDWVRTYLEKESTTYGVDKRSFKDAYMTDFLQHLINEGRRVTPVLIDGGWLEIDHVHDLDLANQMVHTEGEQLVITR